MSIEYRELPNTPYDYSFVLYQCRTSHLFTDVLIIFFRLLLIIVLRKQLIYIIDKIFNM